MMVRKHSERGVDVCVCTFRGPGLAGTLSSIAAMTLPTGFHVGIIVADNDETPSARPLVERLSGELTLPILYLHCPARNISVARNACLDASEADLVAFIDDDETATPTWLAEMVKVGRESGADVVLGPVRARYETTVPTWMKAGDFHSTLPVWVKGEIRTGYTGNVLIRTGTKSVAGRRFDPMRGQSGGEDTAFFDAVWRAGGTFAYAPRAVVEEAVPAGRATFRWLARRRFRAGQTHGHLLAKRMSKPRFAGELVLAAAKIAYCFVCAGLMGFRSVSRNRNILRGTMHAGVFGGLLGAPELRHYGAPSPERGLDASAFHSSTPLESDHQPPAKRPITNSGLNPSRKGCKS